MPITQDLTTLPAPSDEEPAIALDTLISTPPTSSLVGFRPPTLLLLHFWGGSHRTFSRLISELGRDRDQPIIAPSLRGWGRSSKPADPQAYHIRHYADDIVALLASLQATRPELLRNGVVLVGHSMGGKIAQVLLARPEIVALVKGVVLLGPAPAGALQLPSAEMREVQAKAYESAESADAVMRGVLVGDVGKAGGEEEIAALVGDAVAGSTGARAAWPLYGMAEDWEADVRQEIGRLEQERPRALVVIGGLDQVEPEAAVRGRVVTMLQEEGVKVWVGVLPGVGHMIPIEAPLAVARLIGRFLSSLSE